MAVLIQHSPKYIGGKQIVQLYSCSTGKQKDGFAQQLANLLGVKVKAPNMDIYPTKSGDFIITEEVNGEFKRGH